MRDYCFHCHKYVNLKIKIFKDNMFDSESLVYHCEECRNWIKTINKPILKKEKNNE